MICKNCGADYEIGAYCCPYCKSENPIMAQIRKEQKLQAFDEEADQIHENFRVNTIRKMNKSVMGVFIVILCIIFLGIISAIISGPILSSLEYSSMQKHLDKLEIMFQEQKWDEMKIYYTDNKLYNSQYVKYDEVNTLYYYCNQQYLATIELQQFMDVTYLGDLPVEEIKKLISIYMDTVLFNGSRTIIHSKLPVNDKKILGNEKILSEFRDEAIIILQRFYVSEEELQFIYSQTRIDMEDDRFVEILDKMVEEYYREIIDNQVVDYEM